MTLASKLLPALEGLDAECGVLLSKLQVTMDASARLRQVCEYLGIDAPAPVYSHMSLPALAKTAVAGAIDPVPAPEPLVHMPVAPADVQVQAEVLSAAAPTPTPKPVPSNGKPPLIQSAADKRIQTGVYSVQPHVAPVSPAPPSELTRVVAHRVPAREVPPTPKEERLTPEDFITQLSAWDPTIDRGSLSLTDIYQALQMNGTRWSRNLPATMDLRDAVVVKTLSDHLRHVFVPQYPEFCSKLQQFTGMGRWYKVIRDKAEAAVHAAFPEMAMAKAKMAVTFPQD